MLRLLARTVHLLWRSQPSDAYAVHIHNATNWLWACTVTRPGCEALMLTRFRRLNLVLGCSGTAERCVCSHRWGRDPISTLEPVHEYAIMVRGQYNVSGAMNRTLIVGGQTISRAALGQPIDEFFDRLFAAYLGNTPLVWEEFAVAAMQYFDNTLETWGAHDAYFEAFTIIWKPMLDAGRYQEAEQLWERALQPALEWERTHAGQRVHKGTPFYFRGMTAILRGEMDHGYLLVHQGVDEDIKSFPAQWKNAPGYALVSLDYNKPDQAFRGWVQEQARFLENQIASYNTTHSRALTIDDVRRRFFQAPPSTETVFLLTYTLARLMRLDKLPPYTLENTFAGQLELNLLFDITLVIEAAMKAKNVRGTFIHFAVSILNAAGAELTEKQLREVNEKFIVDFDGTLQAALATKLTVTPSVALNRLQCDVAIAYGLRNHGAHNTGTAPTMWKRFHEVRQTLFRVLLLTIEHFS